MQPIIDPTTDLIVGILLAFLAAAMFSVGAIMQKKAVQEMPDIKLSDMDTIKPMLKNRPWVIGTIIALGGGGPYIASQYFISIGFTQLLLASGLIILVFLANRWIGEKIGRLEWAGITVIVIGTICLGLAEITSVKPSLLFDPGFLVNSIIFYIVFGSVIVGSLLLYKLSDWGAGKNMAILSGIFFGVGAFSSQIGTLGLHNLNFLIIAFGYLALLIGNAVGTLIVNIAFQKGKAVMVIPLQSAGNYLIPVFAGLIIFQQTFTYDFLFWPAVLFIMVGVFLLSRIQAELEETPSEESKPDTNIEE